MTEDGIKNPANLDDVNLLIDAAWGILDDLATGGRYSVCSAAKAKLRVAIEPFLGEPKAPGDWITIAEAKQILKECDR